MAVLHTCVNVFLFYSLCILTLHQAAFVFGWWWSIRSLLKSLHCDIFWFNLRGRWSAHWLKSRSAWQRQKVVLCCWAVAAQTKKTEGTPRTHQVPLFPITPNATLTFGSWAPAWKCHLMWLEWINSIWHQLLLPPLLIMTAGPVCVRYLFTLRLLLFYAVLCCSRFYPLLLVCTLLCPPTSVPWKPTGSETGQQLLTQREDTPCASQRNL